MGNPTWRWGKQMEAEANSIGLWTKNVKYTPELPFGRHRETNRAGGQITQNKSKVAASNLKGTWYERKMLKPVVHLSMAKTQYEMSAWGLQTARWACAIEVKSSFLLTVALCPVALKYEVILSHWGLHYIKVHFIYWNTMEWFGVVPVKAPPVTSL